MHEDVPNEVLESLHDASVTTKDGYMQPEDVAPENYMDTTPVTRQTYMANHAFDRLL